MAKESAVEVISAYNRIPYALINAEIDGPATDILAELGKIVQFYNVYEKGAKFAAEGSGGDYTPSLLRYKTAAGLINKEARFLFGETPDIVVDAKGDVGKVTEEAKNALTAQQDLVTTVLKANKFEKILLQAAKDCFIGKRVAGVVNFNEEDGVTVTFLNSLNFVYETDIGNPEKLTKFVSFTVVRNRTALKDKRIYKKKYQMEKDGFCWIEEMLYDGTGSLIEEITEYQPTKFDRIPAVIILNDGLTGDVSGKSEIEVLKEFESLYSKLANADIDAERKGMNQVVYTIDMDNESTKKLSRAPGSYWDLQSDQNADKPAPQVGVVEGNMGYSQSLNTTLDRLKGSMYEQLDVPKVDLETMSGVVTSGKALKAIYWPLIVRCKEKMKTWGPQLEYLVELIIDGAMLYPETVKRYTNSFITPVAHEIHVLVNYPLPEDEMEEKQMDLAEVTAQTMSKKAYMIKWRELTDQEADDEIKQIALERELLENSFMEDMGGGPVTQLEEISEDEV